MMVTRLAGRDPRPDLCEDHELWEAVLQAASEISTEANGLYWTLDGLRCMGARLRPTRLGSLRLEPGEETPEEEFQADCRRYLSPHTGSLRQVLRVAAADTAEVIPVGELQPA